MNRDAIIHLTANEQVPVEALPKLCQVGSIFQSKNEPEIDF